MVGAARLDSQTFEEVSADQTATRQALLVLLIAALTSGLGIGHRTGALPLFVFNWGIAWATWVLIIYVLSTTLFRVPDTVPDWGQLVRTTAFAQAPVVFMIFGLIPVPGTIVFVLFSLVTVWQVAAMTVATRQALGYQSMFRAAIVVVAGVVPLIAVEFILSLSRSV